MKKICRLCKDEKDLDEFRPAPSSAGGRLSTLKPDTRRGVCRKCENEGRRARRSEASSSTPAEKIDIPDPDKTPPAVPVFRSLREEVTFPPDPPAVEAPAVPADFAYLRTILPGYSTTITGITYDPVPAPPLRRVLFIPDTHAPYHDEKKFQLMLRAAQVLKPDIVIVLGDFADFYAVSSHSKNPDRAADLEYEVGIVKEKLREVESLNASTNVYIAGNHEDRLSRYLCERAPALFKTVQIPEVLDLKERWHYVPYKGTYRLGKLHLTHDVGTAGRNANRQAMDAYQGSCIIGHTHRMEYSVVGRVDGPPVLGAMLGWLGDFERIDYMHSVKARRDWVHGFGIGFMEPNGIVHVQPVPIVNDAVCILGQVVR